MSKLQFRRAKRSEVPLLISLASLSGGGKTFSALLMAAGLVKSGGVIRFADTENGRGEMYEDSPIIRAALGKNSYEYTRMDSPFTPASYSGVIQAAEEEGQPGDILIFDSFSHEWEGSGGAFEMAHAHKLKNNPNWALAKLEHKKLLNRALMSTHHIIFCLRAREKVKMFADGKYEALGLRPITEKSFPFEMMVSLLLDETTHLPKILKAPESLRPIFEESPHLVSKSDGERIRVWNETGEALTLQAQLERRAKSAASQGMEHYEIFYKSIPPAHRKVLLDSGEHEANKALAATIDEEAKRAETDPGPAMEPDEEHPEKETNDQH